MNKIGRIFLLMVGILLGWYLATKGLEFLDAPGWTWMVISIAFGVAWIIWGNIIIFRKAKKQETPPPRP